MFRFSRNRDFAIEGASRVNEVLGVEDPPAIVALVPTSVRVVAVRAFAFDETVRKESLVFQTV